MPPYLSTEYDRRMHRVLEHIDTHLDEPLDLTRLASVADLSAFHFHRVFAAWMGETLGAYTRRRRLEIGALRLVTQPRLPVLRVALDVGFGSAEAFTRAFRTRFGAAPSAWRRSARAQRSKAGQVDSNLYQDDDAARRHLESSPEHRERIRMNVTVNEREPDFVAYLRHVGEYGKPISDFWMNVVAPWMKTNGLFGRARYGISHDDPTITASDLLRYDACVAVPKDFSATGNYQTTTIPGGKYAVLHFEDSLANIEAAWNLLLRDWLPSSGMQLDARPMFEYYPINGRHDAETGVIECQLCIPVQRLTS